jgi:hypothetical protein
MCELRIWSSAILDKSVRKDNIDEAEEPAPCRGTCGNFIAERGVGEPDFSFRKVVFIPPFSGDFFGVLGLPCTGGRNVIGRLKLFLRLGGSPVILLRLSRACSSGVCLLNDRSDILLARRRRGGMALDAAAKLGEIPSTVEVFDDARFSAMAAAAADKFELVDFSCGRTALEAANIAGFV